jgi:SRSO17 transposase
VSTLDDRLVADGHSVNPDRWRALFDELMGRIGGRFVRVEPRRRARGFVLGLIAGLPRKNCWTIAEHAGDVTPDGMQYLLERARWEADEVRDDVRGYVTEHLADAQAVLVVDETGDVKKGVATAGVQRQYTGTAGRVENAQVAVYLTYAGRGGHALIDRRLYLPRSWAGDPARRAAAGIPDEVAFATKPALAAQMIGAALDAGVPAAWVTGDEVYGADPGLRAGLERRSVGYVLAVAKDHHVTTAAGKLRGDAISHRLPRRSWQRLSAGPGLKGHRFYDWAWVVIEPGGKGRHWLLIRRNRRTGELAYYHCWSPRHVPLATFVRVAGRRWTTEENFQAGKGLARAGRAPGPHLDRLAPLGHPGHARAGVPHHRRRGRARTAAPRSRADPAHPQRDRLPVRQPDHRARARRPAPAVLVRLAPPPPAPGQGMPLPASRRAWPITPR